MSIKIRVGPVLMVVAVVAILGYSTLVEAQQNLFNVPNAQITKPGEVFFQQQFNFSTSGQANTTIDFGVWDNFEVGVNLLDVPLYDNTSPTLITTNNLSDFLLNMQVGVPLGDGLQLGVGTQFGVTAANLNSTTRFVNYDWIVLEAQGPPEWGKYYVGTYYGNPAYLGSGSSIGVLLGAEIPLIEERLAFVADAIVGTNDISVAVIGGVYIIPDTRWQISLGVQVPLPESGNKDGLVIELTRI